MLGWVLEMGASQTAIAEHATPTLSDEQQGVLTQALISMNSTTVHGVTISTVLLRSDGFIPGLATVTKDALDLSSSDIFLLAVCYEATRSGGGGKNELFEGVFRKKFCSRFGAFWERQVYGQGRTKKKRVKKARRLIDGRFPFLKIRQMRE